MPKDVETCAAGRAAAGDYYALSDCPVRKESVCELLSEANRLDLASLVADDRQAFAFGRPPKADYTIREAERNSFLQCARFQPEIPASC